VDLYSCAYLTRDEFSQLLLDYPKEASLILHNSIQEAQYILVRYGDMDRPYFNPPLFNVLKAHEGFYKPQMPISIEEYTQVFMDNWLRYLHRADINVDCAIFDGCFLYHRANDLIMNYTASNEMVAAHLNSLLSVIAPYRPLLFYFSSEDVGKRLIEARLSRRQSEATEARIKYEEERKRRQMQILRLLSIQAHIYDISSGWEKALNEMADILIV
jgi:hypothetical protein